jgi:hypothetical protein
VQSAVSDELVTCLFIVSLTDFEQLVTEPEFECYQLAVKIVSSQLHSYWNASHNIYLL